MFFTNKIFGIKNNKIVFRSFIGKQYSDSPKVISEKLKKINSNLDIVWIMNDIQNKEIPSNITVVSNKSIRKFYELSRAKVWIDNFPMRIPYKSKEQLYIQTWHGDRGFKKILYDKREKTDYLYESQYADLMLSGSDYGEKKIRSAFNYEGEILKYGLPRNDLLLSYTKYDFEKISKKLKIDKNKKILMYAPTFRNKQKDEQSIEQLNLIAILNALETKTEDSWICFIRMHAAVIEFSNIPNDSRIINVSDYAEMSELLLVTDFLISDYSSCVGDFALLERPIVLFQPDRIEYMKSDREFYFDIDESPYFVAKDTDELINIINDTELYRFKNNTKNILDFYGCYETGKSTENISNYILKFISN